ncbi:UNVERIFIED_CONTAM: hypothetical protein PYX00_002860 [Menopon gallinae]|uniref:Protein pinocchio n=1 Tax=Menopon gallinae TaxID=328185 RepID=A0AAW2HYS9_9NEOP
MSLAGVHHLDMHTTASSKLINRSQSQSEQAVLSIEELRLQLNSCFTCGVSWQEEHVSLDCSECGGYSLERPCPMCDGQCDNMWKRDLTMTHASGRARWEGECGLERSLAQTRLLLQPLSLSPESEAQLCQRLENLKS